MVPCSFLTGVCLSVTLHIVDLWQYYVCCTRSGVIRCTLFMVLLLGRMYQRAVTGGALVAPRLLAAEPRSERSSWPALIVWDCMAGFKSRGIMPSYCTSCSLPFCLLYYFPFYFFSLTIIIMHKSLIMFNY